MNFNISAKFVGFTFSNLPRIRFEYNFHAYNSHLSLDEMIKSRITSIDLLKLVKKSEKFPKMCKICTFKSVNNLLKLMISR